MKNNIYLYFRWCFAILFIVGALPIESVSYQFVNFSGFITIFSGIFFLIFLTNNELRKTLWGKESDFYRSHFKENQTPKDFCLKLQNYLLWLYMIIFFCWIFSGGWGFLLAFIIFIDIILMLGFIEELERDFSSTNENMEKK